MDAVVSQDSDCFAYGAKKVYRNFSVSNSAGGGALQGSVDCYETDRMIQKIGKFYKIIILNIFNKNS